MKFNCYFCQSKLLPLGEFTSIGHCDLCDKTYRVETYTCAISDEDSRIHLAHIYINKIHITMHIKKNITLIATRDGDILIMQIDGCPFTPKNVHQKLKTYLLFS